MTRWTDRPCVIFASGPSLTQQDTNRLLAIPDIVSIAVNDTYRVAPSSDVLYAGDVAWWRHHNGAPNFNRDGLKLIPYGPKGSSRWQTAEKFGLGMIPISWGRGLSFKHGEIHAGHCSGFAALNLSIQYGAGSKHPIYLLGFDCHAEDNARLHFFGQHPKPLRNGLPFKKMIKEFELAARQIEDRGLKVINLSRKTALECFDMMSIEDIE